MTAPRFDSDAPPHVRRYLDRVLPSGASTPPQVRLTQAGELRLKPNGRWLRFTATQESRVREIAFSWSARVRVLPLVSLHVVDRFAGEEGTGEVRLFGFVPVAREAGQPITEGSALRYLAELPWNPHALLANRHLGWRELDIETVEVAMRVASVNVALRLHFDADGDIVKTWTDARPHKEGDRFVPRPWRGAYSGYQVIGGVRIPTRAEVSWELPEGLFTWFRGTITSFEGESDRDATSTRRP